ncbi:hypothetical protein C8R45DRAFT_1100028 [Mycena sanguinolenta]|nr:hypothetical protein C8R45DRAFT_1100028 [Mycena sanguinolenta]
MIVGSHLNPVNDTLFPPAIACDALLSLIRSKQSTFFRESVHHLCIFGSSSIDFTHSPFLSITHLEIFDAPDNIDLAVWSTLTRLPHLTHLAFNDEDYLLTCLALLPAWETLRVLVVLLNGHPEAELLDQYNVAELSNEPRFMVMVYAAYIADWIRGIQTGNDYWSQAENHIAKRKSGQVERGTQAFIECDYSDGDICSYSQGNGIIQTGSKACPSSINSSTVLSTSFECNQPQLQASPLIGSSVTPTAENLACVYADATLCTYSQYTGLLSTGAGICPQTATCSPECPVSSSAIPTSIQSGKAAKGILASSSASGSSQLSPALIVVIALNGFLVIVVLVLGGVWLKRLYSSTGKRYDSKYHALSLGTAATSNNHAADGVVDEVPLTHGAPGRYRDELGPGGGRSSRRASRESIDLVG